jgi:hypothetical protein
MNRPKVSLDALQYMQKTEGWVDVYVPYLLRVIERQEKSVRRSERYLVKGDENRLQYELGYLDGLRTALKGPESILKGAKLRSRLSPSP